MFHREDPTPSSTLRSVCRPLSQPGYTLRRGTDSLYHSRLIIRLPWTLIRFPPRPESMSRVPFLLNTLRSEPLFVGSLFGQGPPSSKFFSPLKVWRKSFPPFDFYWTKEGPDPSRSLFTSTDSKDFSPLLQFYSSVWEDTSIVIYILTYPGRVLITT